MRILLAILFVSFFAAVENARASTVIVFDQPYSCCGGPYVEQGYSFTDNFGYLVADAGSMHFDISGGPYSNSRTMTSTVAGLFGVTALDIISIFPTVATGGLIGGAMNDILFEGFNGSALVAQAFGSSQAGSNTVTFGPAFANLTSFKITGFNPGNIDYSQGFIDVHFLIDNIAVSPVPVPPALPMLAGAIGLMALARRRGPKAAA